MFLLAQPLHWHIIVLNVMELAACVAGFISWRKMKGSYWRAFPVYLSVILMTELTAEYFKHMYDNDRVNNNIYRFFGIPLEFVFLFWLFYQHFRKTDMRMLPTILATGYVVSIPVDILYVSRMRYFFDSFSYCVGNVFLLVLLMTFFLRFSRSEAILAYKSDMMFWVCTGLMIFYLGTLPLFGMWNTLIDHYRNLFWVLYYCLFPLNYIMYFLFTISFVWGKPR
jgi:hypothetical protein